MFKKTVIIALLAVGLISQSFAANHEKRIYIGSPRQQHPLTVDFKPSKPSFKVNESIKFTMKSNKKVFLFLFNIDYENNEAVMILPNHLQPANRNMYTAGKTFTVPNSNVEFFSDRQGLERIVVIASTKYPKEIAMKQYKKMGNFYLGSAKAVSSQLKRIQLREPEIRSNTKEEIYIKEFDLPIYAQHQSMIPSVPRDMSIPSMIIPSTIISFITTDKSRYRQGEAVTIGYGSNQNGWINIYIKNAHGDYHKLTEQRVHANVMAYTKGQSNQRGQQDLVAIFSKNKGYKSQTKDFKQLKSQQKGFVIMQTAKPQSSRKIVSTQFTVY